MSGLDFAGLAGQLLTLVFLSTAVSTAAFTVTRTKVAKPARDWAARVSTFAGDLVQCPYCLSHWLAAVAVILYQPRLVSAPPGSPPHLAVLYRVADLGVSVLVMVFLASQQVARIETAIKGKSAAAPPRDYPQPPLSRPAPARASYPPLQPLGGPKPPAPVVPSAASS